MKLQSPQHPLDPTELLPLSALELNAYIQELAQENPLVEPEESEELYVSAPPERTADGDLLSRLRWLEDNDHQNRFYQSISDEDLDPLARVGTDGGLEETLLSFVTRQLEQRRLDDDTVRSVRYLTSCLDDDGYLRIPLGELSKSSGIPVERLSQALNVLHTLEPAGVGAENLSQCLALQLHRIGQSGPALDIVLHHLDLLAQRDDSAIAGQLNVSLEEVREAERTIRELEPRPGAVFQRAEQVPYLRPDVAVEEENGSFAIRSPRRVWPPFHINSYYQQLLQQSQDPQVKEYLSAKLCQAQDALQAVTLRETFLLRCAKAILNHQKAFFHHGPNALVPLRMEDVAQELDLPESVFRRASREKYLQCAWGTYPLTYFFSRPAAAESGNVGTAAKPREEPPVSCAPQRKK